MSIAGTFAIGVVAAVAAVLILRLSWGRPARKVWLTAAGWAIAAVGIVSGWVGAGAWGIAVNALWAMAAATILLAWSAWRAPASASRAASNRRVGMLPQGGEPAGIGRRAITFLIVTLGGLVASVAFATAIRWLAVAANADEANANVAALFAAPLSWTILTFVLLITPSRKRQCAVISAAVAFAIPAILTGSLM